MIIGALSDTHWDKKNALPHIIEEFKKRGVELIVHCGDIEEKHVDPSLFADLSVICALTEEQEEKKEKFQKLAPKWIFTVPGERIVKYKELKIYVGHKRSFEFLDGSEEDVIGFLNRIRKENDGLRLVFCGHTHHQILIQTRLINLVNPGAVENSLSGSYEFAIIDTEKEEFVFDKILWPKPTIPEFSIAVIADTLNIAQMDPDFYNLLAKEFKKRKVKSIVHCDVHSGDIGIPELKDFNVYFRLADNQKIEDIKVPKNWIETSIAEVNGYRFFIGRNLGVTFWKKSENGIHDFCLNLREKYGNLDACFCGGTNDALFVWEERTDIINPGDVIIDRGYSILSLPSKKVIFGKIPSPKLPPIE